MIAEVTNRTVSTLHDVRVIHKGGTLSLGDIIPGRTYRMGRFHET